MLRPSDSGCEDGAAAPEMDLKSAALFATYRPRDRKVRPVAARATPPRHWHTLDLSRLSRALCFAELRQRMPRRAITSFMSEASTRVRRAP